MSDVSQGAGLEDGQSSLTSLASSILRGVEENGRRYATYGKEGTYALPLHGEDSRKSHAHVATTQQSP